MRLTPIRTVCPPLILLIGPSLLQQVCRVLAVLKDRRVPRGHRERRVLQGHKGRRVIQELLVCRVYKAPKGPRGLQVLRVNRVCRVN